MLGILKHSWLRYFGITLLILGFVRVPLPASADLHSHHRAVRESSSPLADDGASRSPLSLPFDLLSLVTCSCPANNEESSEDCGGDGEPSDPLDESVLAEESLLRFSGIRSLARQLFAPADFVGVTTDRHAVSLRLNAPTGLARNGTSPSFGASFHAIFQRWSC